LNEPKKFKFVYNSDQMK